jgi:hypothetical protein
MDSSNSDFNSWPKASMSIAIPEADRTGRCVNPANIVRDQDVGKAVVIDIPNRKTVGKEGDCVQDKRSFERSIAVAERHADFTIHPGMKSTARRNDHYRVRCVVT